MHSAARRTTPRNTERIGSLTSARDYRRLLLELLPEQGHWSETEYLVLLADSNRLVELTDGVIEVLPMPTDKHQTVMGFMFMALCAALGRRGKAHTSGLHLRIRPGKIRTPDITGLLDKKDPRRQNAFWTGADLVMEVVSQDKPKRDLLEKRKDYAEGKVPEYWIINPLDETIMVLVLGKKAYREHGVFRRGDTASSVIVPEFTVDASAVFDAD